MRKKYTASYMSCINLLLVSVMAFLAFPSIASNKQEDVLHDFYNSYVKSLLDDEACRNLRGLSDDAFLLEYPEIISSDDGIYMTNATANTSLYFQVKDGKVINFSVENGLMVSPPNEVMGETYFCIISSAQSALHPEIKKEVISELTRKLYHDYKTNGASSKSSELYTHSFAVKDSMLVYKFVNK